MTHSTRNRVGLRPHSLKRVKHRFHALDDKGHRRSFTYTIKLYHRTTMNPRNRLSRYVQNTNRRNTTILIAMAPRPNLRNRRPRPNHRILTHSLSCLRRRILTIQNSRHRHVIPARNLSLPLNLRVHFRTKFNFITRRLHINLRTFSTLPSHPKIVRLTKPKVVTGLVLRNNSITTRLHHL